MLIQRELEQYAVRLLWTLSPRERRLLARQYGLLEQQPLSTMRIAELESVRSTYPMGIRTKLPT